MVSFVLVKGEHVAERALLLEDNASIRELFKTVLMEERFVVLSADSVLKTNEVLLGEIVFSLALLDYELPDGEGPTVARKLRERFGKDIRIIGVSGRWGPDDDWPDPADRDLCDAVLKKPCTLKELRAAIRPRDS
ncbi:MAG: response regulator [Candidatus Pacearchaeota archaeon]|nr:response regulator [Candidatus Pacearchaeota archaeon]